MSTHNGLDLATAEPVAAVEDEGVDVHLRDVHQELMYYTEDGAEPKPVLVRVVGTYSNTYRRAKEAQTTRMMKRRGTLMTGEMVGAQAAELVAACTLGWQGITNAGQLVPFSREAAVKLARIAWIREQLDAAMEDHEAFFRPSSGS